jgi:hypothetical protein
VAALEAVTVDKIIETVRWGNKGVPMKRKATLREMVGDRAIDTSYLKGWLFGQKITIFSILTNTAVYYFKDNYDQRFLDVLENIEVTRTGVTYLQEREAPKRPTSSKK